MAKGWTKTALEEHLAGIADGLDSISKTLRLVRVCTARRCCEVFVASHPRASFCSVRCREREMKGRYRDRKKAAKIDD